MPAPATRRHSDELIIVLARDPGREAQAKPLGADDRDPAVHAALLRHTLQQAAGAGRADVALCTPADRARIAMFIGGTTVRSIRHFEQGPGTLGERMARAINRGLRAGYRSVVLIGADSPQLDPADLRRALEVLASSATPRSAVLGAAEDGGYYLLGVTAPVGASFERTPTGTSHTAAATSAALIAEGFSLAPLEALPIRADVDERADLDRVLPSLATQLRTEIFALLFPPSTRASSRTIGVFAPAPIARPNVRGPPAVV